MTPNASLLIDGNRGIYIPQLFAQNYMHYVTNKDELKQETESLLNGPDDEFYWESWDMMLDNAKLIDDEKRDCILEQDGDLWAIPVNELDQVESE